jgi:RNA polymerase sigma-70 factor (ECF subfamily)
MRLQLRDRAELRSNDVGQDSDPAVAFRQDWNPAPQGYCRFTHTDFIWNSFRTETPFMAADESFVKLLTRVRAGDQDATTQIFERFAHRLLALARSRLDGLTRQKIDPDDVLQSVFRSFFTRLADDQWDLDNWDSLWGLLALITVRKCGHRVEYFRAACRDIHREVSARAVTDSSAPGLEPPASDPTPSAVVMLAETVENLLGHLEVRDRRIVELSLQGHTNSEIGNVVGCTERTVYRVLERVRKHLNGVREEGK